MDITWHCTAQKTLAIMLQALQNTGAIVHFSSWKVTKLLHETEAKVDLVQLELKKWK